MGIYEYYVNKNYDLCIALTLKSVHINTSEKKGSSKTGSIKGYNNLGYYFKDLMLFDKALAYHDSAIIIAKKITGTNEAILEAKLDNTNIYFFLGDYHKCIEESTLGLNYSLENNDSSYYIDFLVQRAQSFVFEKRFSEALSDVEIIIKYGKNPFALASAIKTKGLISEKQKDFTKAELFFKHAIQERLKSGNNGQVASDYIDLGNFYLNSLHNYSKAKESYHKTIEYAKKDKDFSRLAAAHINLGEAGFNEHNYKQAADFYVMAFNDLKVEASGDILKNPPTSFLNLIGNKDRITVLLVNKTELLLQIFKETKEQKYIKAALETALITDSVITQTRHEQSGEQSKLYWRNKTRDFFSKAMEVCYITNDTRHAFYFMEKSRAVLLNDKLNELSASSRLPEIEAAKERELQIKIVTEQQKLLLLESNTPEYQRQYSNSINAKKNLDDFIKVLYQKYPAYYQYKYADEVPKLDSLKKYLSLNHQSFVHYFTNDTVAYILSITAGNTRIFKLDKNNFHREEINGFINFCSNKDSLNYYYTSFKALSNSIYKTLFQPLNLPKGRVIICSDNFLLPFEALYTDAKNGHFLIQDYTFSYAYSATYLLKRFTDFPAKDNFIGFAPVSFQKYLDVPDLKNSATALANSADYYNNNLLLIKNDATKNNFIQKIAGYTIVNVFSHASADSSDKEPKLYMQDSTINLSELQLLNTKPATKLVVLSACQTNVGKNATGEGIYSLARGFTAAGIPSIAATLWNADEDMIYEISANFHKYLSQGMSKDSALQKAKIDFIKNNNSEKALPYYWANMVLIGNTEPLKLLPDQNTQWLWIAIVSGTVLAFATFILLKRKRHNTQ
ncbi:MAG TPA: CHAT domain-containing protein [Panacibacter sp.]|nr:CHAT domain-containing protein [Panacibacter sp.]